MTIYHVSKAGSDEAVGSEMNPFETINHAAKCARSGDRVVVHEGVYREWVKDLNSGLDGFKRRITFEVATGEHVSIKGSEVVTGWTNVEGSVWKTTVDNQLFGDFNPFDERVAGDWIKQDVFKHLGDVYLNGQSFYEVESKDQLFSPVERQEVFNERTFETVKEPHPDRTKYVWLAEVSTNETVIYANFQKYDPNQELTEINVRKSCFYPQSTNINFITVKGFEISQAATPWAPPTTEQFGIIGPHWSKGWIIEDNDIHDAKCVGISLGKEKLTGDNFSTTRFDKPGYQYQQEAVFSALRIGWSKENIGSHLIRHNRIHDCGQAGIVGHLGAIFSKICDNEIFEIATKREFYGWELAGIKLHAAIDVKIEHNRIHHSTLGTWLDWEAQGTRVTRNVYDNNVLDFYVEVSHGPYVVDNNIFMSGHTIKNHADGGAFINNLFNGDFEFDIDLGRSTPYHLPHSTEIMGTAVVYGGDDRFYNNIFAQGAGTDIFEENTQKLDEFIAAVHKTGTDGDDQLFRNVKPPVYLGGNAFIEGAKATTWERNKLIDSGAITCRLVERDEEILLEINATDEFKKFQQPNITTNDLSRVRMVDAIFDDLDGSMLAIDYDLVLHERSDESCVGPIAQLTNGMNSVTVWKQK